MVTAARPEHELSCSRQSTVSAIEHGGHSNFLWPALIIAYALLNVLVVSPSGNFPVNDDWMYSNSVFQLLQTGKFHFVGCSPANFVHVALGALVALFFGQSHEVLRCFTIVCAAVTSLLVYATLVCSGVRRAISAAMALLIAANPLFVHLSFSFMTDIPALMFADGSMFACVMALRRRSSAWLVAAGVALCAAVLIRQLWVALAACNLIMLAFSKSITRRMRLFWLVSGVVAPCLAASAGDHFLQANSSFADVYAWNKSQVAGVVQGLLMNPVVELGSFVSAAGGILCYFALFCVPVVPLIVARIATDFRRQKLVSGISLLVAAIIAAAPLIGISHSHLMPFSGNLLRIPIVGPLDIMGVTLPELRHGQRVWLTIVSAMLSVPVAYVLIRAALMRSYFSLATLVMFGWVVVQSLVFNFDRYYLAAFVPLLLCVGVYLGSREHPQSRCKALNALSSLLLVMLAFYSTAAAQDFMSWNRARWEALSTLQKLGVPAQRIDGGAEFNYLANAKLIEACSLGSHFDTTSRGAFPRCNWRWWPITREDYIVSFSPVPEYAIIGRYPFFGGLSMAERDVFVLKHMQSETHGNN